MRGTWRKDSYFLLGAMHLLLARSDLYIEFQQWQAAPKDLDFFLSYTNQHHTLQWRRFLSLLSLCSFYPAVGNVCKSASSRVSKFSSCAIVSGKTWDVAVETELNCSNEMFRTSNTRAQEQPSLLDSWKTSATAAVHNVCLIQLSPAFLTTSQRHSLKTNALL